jgi:hypothetical protein
LQVCEAHRDIGDLPTRLMLCAQHFYQIDEQIGFFETRR